MADKRHAYIDSMKLKILERDEYHCAYCGEYASQVDHVVPKRHGGPGTRANGVAACRKCNSRKADHLDMDMITRGLLHLATVGENTDWIDTIDLPAD